MSISFPIFLLLVLLMVNKVYSSTEAENKRCHGIPLLKDINMERLAGNWYGPDIGNLSGDEISRKYVLYSLTSDKRNTSVILPELMDFNRSSTVSKIEMYKTHQIKNSSEFTFESVRGKQNHSAWAIGTDYNTWSTWCLSKPEHHAKGVLFILTREKNPKDTVLESARNSARKAGIKVTKSKQKIKGKKTKKNRAVSMSQLNFEYFG
nr:uncharacterized protein LOC111419490 [Onthophagus taurus]